MEQGGLRILRKKGEALHIGESVMVEVEAIEVKGQSLINPVVTLRIVAPADVLILRHEIVGTKDTDKSRACEARN